jgi:hypothetical protein
LNQSVAANDRPMSKTATAVRWKPHNALKLAAQADLRRHEVVHHQGWRRGAKHGAVTTIRNRALHKDVMVGPEHAGGVR